MNKGARSLVEAEVLHKPDFPNSLLVVHVAMVGSDIKAECAAGACWAHNPEVDGSKPSSATM